MNSSAKIRSLINPRLREIHTDTNGLMSMGDLAVYVGQRMSDAMEELAQFVTEQERQRAVEICDLTLERMVDRELCAKAIRNPETKYPSAHKEDEMAVKHLTAIDIQLKPHGISCPCCLKENRCNQCGKVGVTQSNRCTSGRCERCCRLECNHKAA